MNLLCQLDLVTDAISLSQSYQAVLSSPFKILITVCDSNICWFGTHAVKSTTINFPHELKIKSLCQILLADKKDQCTVFPPHSFKTLDNFLFTWPDPFLQKAVTIQNKKRHRSALHCNGHGWLLFKVFNIFPTFDKSRCQGLCQGKCSFMQSWLVVQEYPSLNIGKNYRPKQFPWQGRVTYVFHSELGFLVFFLSFF